MWRGHRHVLLGQRFVGEVENLGGREEDQGNRADGVLASMDVIYDSGKGC